MSEPAVETPATYRSLVSLSPLPRRHAVQAGDLCRAPDA